MRESPQRVSALSQASVSRRDGIAGSRQLLTIIRMRIHTLRNHFERVKRDSLTRSLVVVFGLLNVFVLGLAVSYNSFRFIEKFEAFGVALNSKLISLLFFALLVLVVLSTVIVAYTTAFLAKETRFFFQLPIPPQGILAVKLTEAITFSSWATLFLGYPVLVSFGVLRDAPPLYYFEAGAILIVFLAFAGLTGALIALIVAPLVRHLTVQQLGALALALLVSLCYAFLNSFTLGDFDGPDQLLVLDRFTSSLAVMHSPYFPSHWASAGVLAAVSGHHRETLFHGTTLLSNTLIFVPIVAWYGARYYGRFWTLSQSSARSAPRKAHSKDQRRHLTEKLATNRLFALMLKDILVFVRDPAQLSQSVLFVLLMAIYSLSLVRVPPILSTGPMQMILFFANLAAVCMILSSFTSRFLFPLISLEGKAFWIVGLAPVNRSFLFYQKAMFGLAVTLALGLPMTLVSTLSLKFSPVLVASAVYVVVLAGSCLTSLSMGLGSTYPNFDEDNPARIAVGMGGTLNFFASAITVAIIVATVASPYAIRYVYAEPGSSVTGQPIGLYAIIASHSAALCFTLALCLFCFRMGTKSLHRSEF